MVKKQVCGCGLLCALAMILLISCLGVLSFHKDTDTVEAYTSLGILINSDNTINKDVATQIITRMGDKTGQIRDLDGGSSDQIAFSFGTGSWSQVFYVVYRDPYNPDIITVMSNGLFTTHTVFNSSGGGNNYQNSTLRNVTLEDYQELISSYPIVDTITVSPNQMSENYKTAQDQQITVNSTTSSNGQLSNLTDKMWVPSAYEIEEFWGLEDNDKMMSVFYVASRSGVSGSSSSYVYHHFGHSMGTRSITEYSYTRYAMHLSLSAIKSYMQKEIVVNTSDSSQGTTSGGGIYEFDYSGNATITATAINGYIFDYWQDSSGNRFYQNPYTFPVTQSETYTAYFRLPQVTITSSTNGSEIASTITEILDTSSRHTLIFTANRYIYAIILNDSAEQRLDGLGGELVVDSSCLGITFLTNATGSQLFLEVFNIQEDIEITLVFSDIVQSYTPASGSGASGISVSATLGGVVMLVGDDFESLGDNDTITFIARLAQNGYRFSHWEDGEGNNLGTTDNLVLTKAEAYNKKITAVFVPIDQSNSNFETNNDQNQEFY